MITNLIVFVGVTVFWCCGFYLATEKGYLLHFLKKPFEKKQNVSNVSDNISATLSQMGVQEYVIPRWVSSPFLTCISCMASFHGILMFCILVCKEVIQFDWIVLILGIMMASFIQTFVYSLYEKIIKA